MTNLTDDDPRMEDDRSTNHLSEGAFTGAILGVAPGVATHDLMMWLTVAVAAGAGIGALVRKRRNRH